VITGLWQAHSKEEKAYTLIATASGKKTGREERFSKFNQETKESNVSREIWNRR